jgi:bis(5'-nucleosyl)-tetraphosphatase (symmetrical)
VQRIFVGDVQGCADELEALLQRAESAFGSRFELWMVGDLVNRGPGSLRALSRVRRLVEAHRARYVLGNHELSLLRTAAGLRELQPRDTFGEVLAQPDADDWVDWLRRRSLVETGRQGRQPFAMVHAAVHPDWGLERLAERARRIEARLGATSRREAERFLATDPREDPDRDALERLTACRSVTPAGSWSEELPLDGANAWHQHWAARRHGYGVVYGHWALQGLHVAPWLRGLDTGCVHHGRDHDGLLTAWLPDPDTEMPFDVPDEHFWQIPARRVYYSP